MVVRNLHEQESVSNSIPGLSARCGHPHSAVILYTQLYSHCTSVCPTILEPIAYQLEVLHHCLSSYTGSAVPNTIGIRIFGRFRRSLFCQAPMLYFALIPHFSESSQLVLRVSTIPFLATVSVLPYTYRAEIPLKKALLVHKSSLKFFFMFIVPSSACRPIICSWMYATSCLSAGRPVGARPTVHQRITVTHDTTRGRGPCGGRATCRSLAVIASCRDGWEGVPGCGGVCSVRRFALPRYRGKMPHSNTWPPGGGAEHVGSLKVPSAPPHRPMRAGGTRSSGATCRWLFISSFRFAAPPWAKRTSEY